MKFRLIDAEKAEKNIAVYIIDHEKMNKKPDGLIVSFVY